MSYNTEKNKMVSLIQDFGRHLSSLISYIKPHYIIPVETKGAVLLELSLNSINKKLDENIKIIYPRALNYINAGDIKKSRFLVIDDAFFSGKTLKDIYNSLKKRGVPDSAIHMDALLNFASGGRDKDYHGDIYDLVFPKGKDTIVSRENAFVSRDEALLYIQNEILTKRMPCTYDHLLIETSNIADYEYDDILAEIAESNRLLNYSKRGGFFTSTIMLDDIYGGIWDFPPKIRIWYNPHSEVLRFAPVGSLDKNGKGDYQNIDLEKRIEDIFLKELNNGCEGDKELAIFEANSVCSRLQMLNYIKYYLTKRKLETKLDETHLHRYYPTFGGRLADIINNYYSNLESTEPLPLKNGRDDEEPFTFLSAAKDIITVLQKAYESQAEITKLRKDFEQKGYTGLELLENLSSKYTPDQIHSAIDYCFDMNYISAFLEKGGKGYKRKVRSTEIVNSMKYHHGELYGAAVIYSRQKPTPAWLLNKVFPIIKNAEGGNLESIIVTKKGPFGDYSEVLMGEDSVLYWTHIPSALWDMEARSVKNVKFKPKEECRELFSSLCRDSRIAPYRTPIEATVFLCDQGGRKGSVLLNILTGQYGGTNYLAYNLEKIINYTISVKPNTKQIKRHVEGAIEKIEFLEELRSPNSKENMLNQLRRKCSRLTYMAPLVKAEAESIISYAKTLKDERIYNCFKELSTKIFAIKDACLDRNAEELNTQLLRFGIEARENSDARNTLLNVSESLINWLYALSARTCSNSHYYKYLYKETPQNNSYPYILAYDLTSARKQHAEKLKIQVDSINHTLDSFAHNWIIALGGKLSKPETSSGDLRYGFFKTLDDAIQAAVWMGYGAQQFSGVNKYFPENPPFGIAVTKGIVSFSSVGDIRSSAMDSAGHLLKGKLKEELDDLAGQVGRAGKGFEESCVQILYTDDFNEAKEYSIPIVTRKTFSGNGKRFNVAAVDINEYLLTHPTPWSHHLKE